MTIKQSTKRKIVRWFLYGRSVAEIRHELLGELIFISDTEIEDIIRNAAIRQEKKK